MATNDKEHKFLRTATGKSGTFNDLYAKYLRGLGASYKGTVQDMISRRKKKFTPSR